MPPPNEIPPPPPCGVTVRNCRPDDHPNIIRVMTAWWGGRDLRAGMPRLFLDHFGDTSYILEDNTGRLVGFLVGFLSPAKPAEGYIHFVGIDPAWRGKGLGRYLYSLFFDCCRTCHRSIVRSCTSPVNSGSIGFHRKMGFRIAPGDAEEGGVPITRDYNRPGDPKVLFVKNL